MSRRAILFGLLSWVLVLAFGFVTFGPAGQWPWAAGYLIGAVVTFVVAAAIGSDVAT